MKQYGFGSLTNTGKLWRVRFRLPDFYYDKTFDNLESAQKYRLETYLKYLKLEILWAKSELEQMTSAAGEG